MDCRIAAAFASMQQPVSFFCKEASPGQHRLEAPSFANPEIQKSINPLIQFLPLA
jgi:hypothetical protein